MPSADLLTKWFAFAATAAAAVLLLGVLVVSAGMWPTVSASLHNLWPAYLLFAGTPVIQVLILRSRHFSEGRRLFLGRIVAIALLPLEILLTKMFLGK